MTPEQVHALLSPAAFEHPVHGLRLIETHISWVILSGDFAYKLKKPLDLGFLDFSTLAARRHYCEEELRLNRRLAADLYLDLCAVTQRDGRLVFTAANSGHEAIDYAVRMRQFAQENLASAAARDGRLTPAHCARLGERIARFHQSLPAQTGGNFAATLGSALAQNFRQLQKSLPDSDRRNAVIALEDPLTKALDERLAVLRSREANGMVRDGHGDLHLANILLRDGDVTAFDCLEFNPALRQVDIQCEIAFPVMDLEAGELSGNGNRLLNTWLEFTGDYEGLALHDVMRGYLALVRAKVLVLAALEASTSAPDLTAADPYLLLAGSALQPRPLWLCLMMGVSGSGKSTVAADLAARSGAIRIRADVERKRLFGLAPDGSSAAAGLADVFYTEQTSDRVFALLAELAGTILAAGFPVIVDATFIRRARREAFAQLAADCRVPLAIAHCLADEGTLRARLERRNRTGGDASEAGIDVMLSQQQSVELPDDGEPGLVIRVDTEAAGHLDDLRAQIAALPGATTIP